MKINETIKKLVSKKLKINITDENLESKISNWLQDRSLATAKIYPSTQNNGILVPSKVIFKENKIFSVKNEFAYILMLAGLEPTEECTLSIIEESNFSVSLSCYLTNADEFATITLIYTDGWDFPSLMEIECQGKKTTYIYSRGNGHITLRRTPDLEINRTNSYPTQKTKSLTKKENNE